MRSVKELQRLAANEDEEIILFNPMVKDFSAFYDKEEYVIKGKATERFPKRLGQHLKKHLIDFVINEREADSLQERFDGKIAEEVEVKL